jgi:predicted NAD/FAD-binding protein
MSIKIPQHKGIFINENCSCWIRNFWIKFCIYLSKKHKVDLFEKEDRFGGHSHTLDIHYSEKEKVAVDIGFMVFNKHTYPNLINFFSENNIEIEKSDMSFSVTVKGTNIEYCGKGLAGIFF